jgi:hypothetical protein
MLKALIDRFRGVSTQLCLISCQISYLIDDQTLPSLRRREKQTFVHTPRFSNGIRIKNESPNHDHYWH